MFNALVDTLMALWNATWREKVAPVFVAVLVVGVSVFLFVVLSLPTFSPRSAASSHGGLEKQSKKSVAINPHATGSVQAIAVPTPAQTSDTKNSPLQTPIPASTEGSATHYSPTPIPTSLPGPGIVIDPGIDGSAYIGTTNIAPTDTSPASKEVYPPVKHDTPSHTAVTSAPSVAATPRATLPASINGTPTPVSTLSPPPTIVVTPPTGGVEVTPTVVIPVGGPTPTPPLSPTTSGAERAPTAVIIPTRVEGPQATAAVPSTPIINSSTITAPAG